jgi:hypothetical protein
MRLPSNSIVLILKSILHKTSIEISVEYITNTTIPLDVGRHDEQLNSLHDTEETYPIVVIKLVVKEPSENRNRRQLLPTPRNK